MHSQKFQIRLQPCLWISVGLLALAIGAAGCNSDEGDVTTQPAPATAHQAIESPAPPAAERPSPPGDRESAEESTPRKARPPADVERRSGDDDYDYQDEEDLALALEGLKNPDPEERSDAVLDIEPEGPGLQYLLEVVTDDPEPEVRMAAVSQLGDSESPEAINGLVTALNDPNSEVVLEAIDSLEYSADHNVIGNLEKLLQHPDPEVREAAEDAIDYLEE